MLFLIWKFGYNKCHIANQVFLFQDIHPPTVESAVACLSTRPGMKIYKNNLQTENLQHVNQTLFVLLTLSFPLDASLFERTCLINFQKLHEVWKGFFNAINLRPTATS